MAAPQFSVNLASNAHSESSFDLGSELARLEATLDTLSPRPEPAIPASVPANRTVRSAGGSRDGGTAPARSVSDLPLPRSRERGRAISLVDVSKLHSAVKGLALPPKLPVQGSRRRVAFDVPPQSARGTGGGLFAHASHDGHMSDSDDSNSSSAPEDKDAPSAHPASTGQPDAADDIRSLLQELNNSRHFKDEQLVKAEEAVRTHERHVAEAKRRLARRKAEQNRRRIAEAADKLKSTEDTIAAARARRAELHERVAELRARRQQHYDVEVKAGQELWEFQREKHIEALARQRIRLQDMSTRRKDLDDTLTKRLLELQAIEEERGRQGQTAQSKLQEIIDKTEHLAAELNSGSWDDREKARLAQALLQQGSGDGAERLRLVDELATVRRQRRNQQEREAAARLRELNAQREQLAKAERQLVKKRRLIKALHAKGLDFLVEMELGNAPPLEYILQNLPDDFASLDAEIEEADDELDVNAVVQQVKRLLPMSELQLQNMRTDHKEFLATEQKFTAPKWPSKPYAGGWGVQTIPLHLHPVWDVCQAIVYDIVEDFLGSVQDKYEIIEQTANQRVQWEKRLHRIRRKQAESEVLTSVNGVLGEFIDEVIEEFAKTVLTELDFFKRSVFANVTDILIKSSVTPQHKVGYDQMLRSTIAYAQHERLMRDTSMASMGLPVSRHSQRFQFALRQLTQPINPGTGPKRREQIMRDRERLLADEKAGRLGGGSDDEDGELPDLDEELDYTLVRMAEVELLSVESDRTGIANSRISEEAVAAERMYWKNIEFVPLLVELSSANRHITQITCIEPSAFGNYLAAGTRYGAVGIFEMHNAFLPPNKSGARDQPKLIFSHVPSGNAAGIVQLRWSSDGASQLLAVDVKNEVHVFAVRPAWHKKRLGQGKSRGQHTSLMDTLFGKEEYHRPEKLLPMRTVNAASFLRLEDKSDPVHKPVVADWFPGFTLTGHQPSFMVGCESGALIKWNTHVGRHPNYMLYSRNRMNAYNTAVAINAKYKARSKAAREAAANRAERRLSMAGRVTGNALDAYMARDDTEAAVGRAEKARQRINIATDRVRRASQVQAALAVAAIRMATGMMAGGGKDDDDEDSDGKGTDGDTDSDSDSDDDDEDVDDTEMELFGDDRRQFKVKEFTLELMPTLVGAPSAVAVFEPVNPKLKGDSDRIRKARQEVGDQDEDADGGLNLHVSRKRNFDMKRVVHTVQREYFIGHTSPVIFVGIASVPVAFHVPTVGAPKDEAESSPQVIVVTVDATGHIIYWPYRRDNFGAFVWFTPGVKLKLDMQIPTFTQSQFGEQLRVFPPEGVKMPSNPDQNPNYQKIVKALFAPFKDRRPFKDDKVDGNRRVIYAPENAIRRAKPCDFDVITLTPYGTMLSHEQVEYTPVVHDGKLLDVQMIANRTQLLFLTQFAATKEKPTVLRIAILDIATKRLESLGLEIPLLGTEPPRIAISPVLTVTRCDYLYLMMDNTVRVLSLATGKPVTAPISPLRRDETNKSLVSLKIIGANEYLAVCGPDSAVLYIYHLKDSSTTEERQAIYQKSTLHERARVVPTELRVFGRLRRR